MNTLLRKARTFVSLSRGCRQLAFQALWLSLYIDIQLKFKGYRRTVESLRIPLSRTISETPNRTDIQQKITECLSAQRLACRYYRKAKCLNRSLVLKQLLLKQGIQAQLCIGVKQQHAEAASIDAHAWLEYQGHVLNDRADIRKEYQQAIQEQIDLIAKEEERLEVIKKYFED